MISPLCYFTTFHFVPLPILMMPWTRIDWRSIWLVVVEWWSRVPQAARLLPLAALLSKVSHPTNERAPSSFIGCLRWPMRDVPSFYHTFRSHLHFFNSHINSCFSLVFISPKVLYRFFKKFQYQCRVIKRKVVWVYSFNRLLVFLKRFHY